MHVKKLRLYQVHRQQILVLSYTVFGIPRFDNWLEGLTGPRNVVTLTVKVSYSTRIQIKISKGKRCSGWSSGTLDHLQASSLPPVQSHRESSILSAMTSDNTCTVSPTTHPCLDAQGSGFYWGGGGPSHRHAEHV